MKYCDIQYAYPYTETNETKTQLNTKQKKEL